MAKNLDINDLLVEKLKRGDHGAAKSLYENYNKAMYNTLIRLVGDSMEAQDLLQEAFIKAFNNIDSFRGDATFGSWLKRIVVNTGLTYLRKKKIQYEELNEEFEMEEQVEVGEEIEAAQIHAEIKKLPTSARAVLSLYLIEGFSHKEIAEELDISISTSKTQYMRGKKLLTGISKT